MLAVANHAVNLGHYYHLATWNAILSQSLAHDALRLAIGINVGGVPGVDAAIVSIFEEGKRLCGRIRQVASIEEVVS